jgi:galactose mutarotase-like enzyme
MTERAEGARETTVDGLQAVELCSPEARVSATFVPGAGMFGSLLSHLGDQLLHVPGGAAAYAASGTTAGIPLLYPWANRLAGWSYEVGGRRVELARDGAGIRTEEHGLPIHGLLAAARGWQLEWVGVDAGGAGLHARFDFAPPELLASFPFPHVLRMEVALSGPRLRVATIVEATGDVAVPVSFGFHPYLRLPGVAREEWELTTAFGEHLLLDEQMIPSGRREPAEVGAGPLGVRVFDDGYAELGPPPQFRISGGGRAIEVACESGYPYAQLYAPPGSDFICFEPMTAPANALLRGGAELPMVAPGASFEAVFSITVTDSGEELR